MTVAALTLSASALIGIAMHEGWRDRSYDDGLCFRMGQEAACS